MFLKPHRWTKLGTLTAGGLLSVMLIASPTFAQSPASPPSTDSREEERTALYREGVALAEAGKWHEALEKFQAVVAIRSAPAALIALATAQENSGKLAHAARTYEAAEQGARAGNDEGLVEKARAGLTALQPRIGRLVLRLPSEPAGITVAVDGERIQPVDGGIAIDPGKHRVSATAADHDPFETELDVAAGERKEVVVALRRQVSQDAGSATAPVTPTGVDATPGRSLPVGPIVLGGVGLAATIAGIVVRVNGQSDYDEAAKNCTNDRCSSQPAVDDGNAARGRMLTGTVVAGVGVAALAAAGVWWLLPANKEQQGASGAAGIAIGLTSLGDGAFLRARGRF